MKKYATILALAATLMSNGAFAQSSNTGAGALAARTYSNDAFAWGIGLGMLAVVGVIVGVTVGAATGGPSSFSHSGTATSSSVSH